MTTSYSHRTLNADGIYLGREHDGVYGVDTDFFGDQIPSSDRLCFISCDPHANSTKVPMGEVKATL